MLHVEAIPIWFFLKSSLVKPTAWSIALLAARSAPSTTSDDQWRFKDAAVAFFDLEADELLIKEGKKGTYKRLRYVKLQALASNPSNTLDATFRDIHAPMAPCYVTRSPPAHVCDHFRRIFGRESLAAGHIKRRKVPTHEAWSLFPFWGGFYRCAAVSIADQIPSASDATALFCASHNKPSFRKG